MFYCEECRQKREWPTSTLRSRGNCELCESTSICYDVPTSMLPTSRKKIKKTPKPPKTDPTLDAHLFMLQPESRSNQIFAYCAAVYRRSDYRMDGEGIIHVTEVTETGAPYYEVDMSAEERALFRAACEAIKLLRLKCEHRDREKKAGKRTKTLIRGGGCGI